MARLSSVSQRSRRAVPITRPLALLLAVTALLSGAGASRAHAAAAGTLDGIVAEPDGDGARIQLALSGAFQFLVTPYPDRIVIVVDGIAAEPVEHHLTVGPVSAIVVRTVRAPAPRVEVVVATRVPLDVAGTSAGADTLTVRLLPRGASGAAPQRAAAAGSPGSDGAALPARGASPSSGSTQAQAEPGAPASSAAAHTAPAPGQGPGSPPAPGPANAGVVPPASTGRRAPAPADHPAAPPVMHLDTGAGRLLRVGGLVRVAVSDPQVVGVIAVSSRELLITGRAAGRTTMYVWEDTGRLLAYVVEVSPAVDRLAGLRHLLAVLFPSAAITVTEALPDGTSTRTAEGGRNVSAAPASVPAGAGYAPQAPESVPGRDAGSAAPAAAPAIIGPQAAPQTSESGAVAAVPGGPPPTTGAAVSGQRLPAVATPAPSGPGSALVLTGAVETQMDRQKAEEIAHAFAPVVVNLLDVRRPVQLKLQVEVVELNRNAMRALGITWGGGEQTPGAAPSLNGGVYNFQILTAPAAGAAGLDLLIAQVQALAQHGLARVLAEPSLVVLAGQSASLLLGGQVPIPIAEANGVVAVEYKDFGVILSAHPEYQDDGRVFLQIAPEVSTLDFANAVKLSGFTIPALRVRRAQTAVSMLPSQTLVVGGLLQHQDSELLQKLPLLGDLPIIGPLFRSKTFQHQETDLVIFVTPVVVQPGGSPPVTP